MSQSRLLLSILVGVLALTLSACGGGGQGLRVESDSILVTSTSIPDMTSGEPMNHVIPLTGGCGGPYVLQLIAGEMPDGLSLDNDAVAIRGVLLEDGDFDFTIQVTDSGCEPFASTTATFSMQITIGDIRVVDVLQDGNPSLIPAGALPYNPDYPALPRTVYNDFVTLEMIVAGGHGPYEATLYDHPDVANDGPMPLGAGVPQNSTSITGAPVSVGPAGGPFLITFKVTDSIGGVGYFTAYWYIDTPPIIIAMDDLDDGKCGELYSATFIAVEGVPPFVHELVEDGLREDYEIDVNPDPANPAADVLFNPVTDTPPDVIVPGALVKITSAVYAGSGNESNYHQTNPGAPPEGIFLDEESGAYSGRPRRRGTFLVHYHVLSTLVPNLYGQHAWKSFEFEMDDADPVVQDATYTIDGDPFAPMPTPPTNPENPATAYNRVKDMEMTKAYNPDASQGHSASGLQFKAMGGVFHDGYWDHPHVSQRDADPTPNPEVIGGYSWDMSSWGVSGQPIGTTFNTPGTTDGVLDCNPALLVAQGYQNIFPIVYDVALPAPAVQDDTQGIRLGIGPDQIIVTESTTSGNVGSAAGSSTSTSGYNTMHDRRMTIKKVFAFDIPDLKVLNTTRDLVAGGVIPPTAGTLPGADGELAALLTTVDLHRISPNPTGWWYDSFNLNPKGLRGLRHGDDNRTRYNYSNSFGDSYNSSSYASNPSSTAAAVPKCTTPTVTHNASLGVYKDGGKLYVFESATHFGIFVIRPDTKIYMPVAFSKSSGFVALGDNWLHSFSASYQSTSGQMPQITVSPDGRFAAVKLLPALPYYYYGSSSTAYEYILNNNFANQTRILLFTLTGETPWSDGGTDVPYKVVQSGSNGSTSEGTHQWASAMALTNNHLYYLCGNHIGDGDYGSWKQHYFYRYPVLTGGAAGTRISSGISGWYNTPGSPMQTSNHRQDRYMYVGSTYSYPYQNLYNDGNNFWEGSAAQHPFRVSADGTTCAFLAGRSPTSPTSSSGSDFFMKHVWVDRDTGGGPTFARASATLRRIPAGGGRLARLTGGGALESYYVHQHGVQNGPTSQFAISDDGLKVAVVVSRKTGAVWSYRGYPYYYAMYNWNVREDIVAFDAVDGSWGNGNDVERQVTGNDANSSPLFRSTFRWRFGALKFTNLGDGFVFWGGISSYDPDWMSVTTSYYYDCQAFVGSLYSYKFSDQKVRHCLSSTDGGCTDARGTIYPGPGTGTKNNVGLGISNSQWTNTAGAVAPNGGFVSENGKYYYIMNKGALSTSHRTQHQLVAVNITSLDGVPDAKGRKNGEGFAVGGWPSRRGFTTDYGRYSYYGHYHDYGTRRAQAATGTAQASIAMSEGGRVFFGAHWMAYGPYSVLNMSTYYRYQQGGPVNATYMTYYGYNGYGPYAGQLALFDSNVGGNVSLLTTLPSSTATTTAGTRRYMKYIEISPDGRAAAFVTAEASSYNYPVAHGREKLGYIADIDLNPATGDLTGTPTNEQTLITSTGRISSSVTFDGGSGSLYYARGTSNENSKQIFSEALGAGSPDPLSSGKRFNCLHAGR